MGPRGAIAVAILVACSACDALSGLSDYRIGGSGGADQSSDGGSGGSSTAGGSAGADACCQPAPADGTLVRVGACSVASDTIALATGEDPGCPACSCELPQGGRCIGMASLSGGCSPPWNNVSSEMGQCVNVQASDWALLQVGAVDGTCSPTPTPVAPPPVLELCAVGAGPCAADEICVEPAVTHCELRDGDVPCPAALPERVLAYAQVNDTRVCDCACEPVEGSCTVGTGTAYSAIDCQGTPSGGVTTDQYCYGYGGGGQVRSFEIDSATFSQPPCTPQDMPSGSVAVDQPMTVCCDAPP